MIDPVPRGNRPDVLLATPSGPVVSRISISFRAMPSERFVPGDRREDRLRIALSAAHALQRAGEPLRVVDEFRHHRPLDAQVARLHRIVGLADDADDASALLVDLDAAERVAELAGGVDDLVRFECARRLRQVERPSARGGSGGRCILWRRSTSGAPGGQADTGDERGDCRKCASAIGATDSDASQPCEIQGMSV